MKNQIMKEVEPQYNTVEDTAYRNTVELLEYYGNELSKEHKESIHRIVKAYFDAKGRIAFGLPTGAGKTTSVVGYLKAVNDLGLNRSVLVCQERVEALCELYRELLKASIPKDKVGLLHGYQYNPTKVEQGVEGYATEASIRESDTQKYQFLLLTHNKVMGEKFSLMDHYRYRGKQPLGGWGSTKLKKRDLCIWDESLMVSESTSIDKEQSVADIDYVLSVLRQRIDQGRTASSQKYQILKDYLIECKKAIEVAFSKDYSDLIEFPSYPDTEGTLQTAINGLLGKNNQNGKNVKRLIDYTTLPCRAVVERNQALIRYEIVVPDEIDNMVILDASTPIRKLVHLDRSITYDPDRDLFKDYSLVTIHYWKGNTGRTSLDKDFTSKSGSKVLDEVVHIVSQIKDKDPDGNILLFTYKERDGINYTAKLRQSLPDAGIHFLTWGQENNLNKYSHCKYVILVGVLHLPDKDLAGMATGQARLEGPDRDITSSKSIQDYQLSEQAHRVYQAFSRGHSRKTINGKAGEMEVYLFHNRPESLRQELNKVMSGAIWKRYSTRYMDNKTNKREELAEGIISVLDSLPDSQVSISTSKLRKEYFPDIPSNSTTWTNARSLISELTPNWIVSGRSFSRFEHRT